MLNVGLMCTLQEAGANIMNDPAHVLYERLLFMYRIIDEAYKREIPLHYSDFNEVARPIVKEKLEKIRYALDEAQDFQHHINLCKEIGFIKEIHDPLMDGVRLTILSQCLEEDLNHAG